MSILRFLLCLFIFNTLSADGPSVVLRARECGMFGIFFDVLAMVQSYEKGLFSSVEVDFAETGTYYDPPYGPNWWSYYCEPIKVGRLQWPLYEVWGMTIPEISCWHIDLNVSREEAHSLVEKYIHFKPHIIAKVDQFCQTHFQDSFVIGIHYRGNDKICEAPRAEYDYVAELLQQELALLPDDNFKIFVATDEEAFLTYMLDHFPGKVCYQEDAMRSTNGQPVHSTIINDIYYHVNDAYKRGEEAVIDCLLLARAHTLLRTSSNLSKFSTFYNLNLKEIQVTRRYFY